MSEKYRLIANILLLGLIGGATPAFAAIYTTIAPGEWDSAATWSGGLFPPTHLAGHVVNIMHRVNYRNGLGDLYVESGTFNVENVLKMNDVNLKMENSSGRLNINHGLLILTNNGAEALQGIVTFTNGAVQLCNGGFKADNSSQISGNGYIYTKAGNIERLASSSFGTGIAWCIDSGNSVSLPTAENCGVAQPPGGDCLSETHYQTLAPTVYDYGDAPASYGEAKHKKPTTPEVYMGSAVALPDSEAAVQTSLTANGDDTLGTDDENAFTALPSMTVFSTSYTLNVPCTGAGATVAGWIDFDQSGAFTNNAPNERAAATCSSGTAALTWNSASSNFPASLAIGSVIVRLRIATASIDVANPSGLANDGEAEDYPLSITCTELTGAVAEAPPAIPLPIITGTKVFVGSRDLSPAEGHVKAFTAQADGSFLTTAAWDAAITMDTAERQAGLYSTATDGSEVLFNGLDDAAFSATTPSAATIKGYTFDPSASEGAYLAGRRNGSFLGPISRNNPLGLINKVINRQLFLDDNAYRTFYNDTVASRSEKVLAASDDGFLYAFNQTDGELAWGWIPRSLVKELRNFSSFQSNRFMRGKLEVIDIKDGSGNYATYVIGAYRNGLGHYVLKVSATALLDAIVWDEDRSSNFVATPNHGEMDFFSDGVGNTFVTYALTDSFNLSTLVIRNIVTGTLTEVSLNFNVTSSLFVMPDFGDANGPAKKTLYLGDSNGNIHRAALLTGEGVLNTVAALKTALQSITYSGTLGASEPILFLGASVSAVGRNYYLRAQSDQRLTVLRYDSSSTNWLKTWTSYTGGAGQWDITGTRFTADTSGPPTDVDNDGDLDLSANGIQSLPTSARITDAAQIVSDTVVVPVSVPLSGACFTKAYFYFFTLSDGTFPDNKFTSSGNLLDSNLFLGFGNPTRVMLSDMPDQNQMRGFGGTDQLPDNSTGVPPSFEINDKVSTGLRGWIEMGRD